MSKKQSKKSPSNKNTRKAQIAAAAAAAAKPAKTKRARAASAPRAVPADGAALTSQPNPRLPPVGTTISKPDRHGAVRCECTVEEGGIRYAGTLYASISAAAMAAAKDLGLLNRTQNGYVFWSLTKPPRAPSDPVEAVNSAWERFHGKASAIVADGITDENRAKVAAALRKQVQGLERLCEQVA